MFASDGNNFQFVRKNVSLTSHYLSEDIFIPVYISFMLPNNVIKTVTNKHRITLLGTREKKHEKSRKPK
jgi:hypothetical protein